MPEGIIIIDWDEYEGGVVSLKYPEELQIPDNFVQLLQISHTFSQGILTLKESNFQALSIGNEAMQKVIVLMLSPFEDETDFYDILCTINQFISETDDEGQLPLQLKRTYEISQSVFKAREAVLKKLAEEITVLKNQTTELHHALRWFLKHETDLQKRIILYLLHEGSMPLSTLAQGLEVSEASLQPVIDDMRQKQYVREGDGGEIILMIYYQI